jgi:integrase
MPKITKRVVDQLTADEGCDQFVWDSELRGFGIRVKQRTGASSYLVNYRTREGAQRRFAFAKTGTVTPDEARKMARQYLAAVATGADPSAERHLARETITVGELCDRYMEAADSGLVITRFGKSKSTSTVLIDKGRIARHIKPCIGNIPVTKLTRANVQGMINQITQGKTSGEFKTKARGKAVVTGGAGTAARVAAFFGGIWTWGEEQGIVSGANPVRGVRRAAHGTKERVLSPSELAALGRVLDEQEHVQPDATTAVRLIALTGMRRSEATGLRWCEPDFVARCFRLEKTKTGRSMRPMGSATADWLRNLAGPPKAEWVFPNRKASGPADLKKRIAALFDAAGLHDARSQTLRRTFATSAAILGYGEATIDDMIGHARRGVTARHYLRVPDEVLLAAADRVSGRMAAALRGELRDGDVIAFPRPQQAPAGMGAPKPDLAVA